jgi:hypothetical protein
MKPVTYTALIALLLALPFVLRCRHNRGEAAQPAGLTEDIRKYDTEDFLT